LAEPGAAIDLEIPLAAAAPKFIGILRNLTVDAQFRQWVVRTIAGACSGALAPLTRPCDPPEWAIA
jgi:hypothetical protein